MRLPVTIAVISSALLAAPIAPGEAPDRIAGQVEWKRLQDAPGMLGLWVEDKCVGKLNPSTGQWTFHTGRPLDLKALAKQFNPPAASTSAPPSVPTSRATTAQSFGIATARTANFIVRANTQADADEFAQLAERERKQRAIEWLGHEMPRWRNPCRLTVDLAAQDGGGATSFDFRGGNIDMQIKGPRNRLRTVTLPHEVTHTVFAHYIGQPVPRWADEGGAQLSEDAAEQVRHDKRCKHALNNGEGIKLSYLFRMTKYPHDGRDILVFYAESYSVARYLVDRIGRPAFLKFVAAGMQSGWDPAAQSIGFKDVDDLEARWIDYLKKGGPAAGLCKCGPSCPGQGCSCGCQPSRATAANWWWMVPATVALSVTMSALKNRRPVAEVANGRS